ncbi:unnamed protein product [Allacma fusca]|uniref:Uncharacterized protein n=1 Tax=Allacma fusca TaxID=39272 RepID=A0A8J2K670_9HEXA|nr:unnamed protein product [Allacma fusca]
MPGRFFFPIANLFKYLLRRLAKQGRFTPCCKTPREGSINSETGAIDKQQQFVPHLQRTWFANWEEWRPTGLKSGLNVTGLH